MSRTQPSANRVVGEDPLRFGYRYLKTTLPDGEEDIEIVPLSEEDLLHPQEDDFIVHNDYHIANVVYLYGVFRTRTAKLTGIRVLGDHIVDFQHGNVQPLGPDITLLNGEPLPWDRGRATFPVGDMKARVLFVLEITSPSTRKKDLGLKKELYYRAGVPLYVIADPPFGGGRKPLGIIAFQAGPNGYESLKIAHDGRLWLDIVDVWLGIEDGQVVCYDENGQRIFDHKEALTEWLAEKNRAEREEKIARQEKARADKEKKIAQQEKARADKEKTRADSAEARIRELEARLAKPNPRKKK